MTPTGATASSATGGVLEDFRDRVKAHGAMLDRRGGAWRCATARYRGWPGHLGVSVAGAETLRARYGDLVTLEAHGVPSGQRGAVMSAETMPPRGQAGEWWSDLSRYVPRSARDVARQIARLCGEGSEVTISTRSLADAVGVPDRLGRVRAYTESGVSVLVRCGWLEVEKAGRGRATRTTYRLLPGERVSSYELWTEHVDVVSDALASPPRTIGQKYRVP